MDEKDTKNDIQIEEGDIMEAKRILSQPTNQTQDEIARLIAEKRELVKQINRITSERDNWQEIAGIDGLTGLFNKEGLMREFNKMTRILDREFDELVQSGQIQDQEIQGFRGFTILWIDMVGLKMFNEDEGWEKGNQRLAQLSDVIRAAARRPLDLKSRLGGDDFPIVLINTDEGDATTVVSTMQELLSDTDITVSIGIADFSREVGLEKAMNITFDAVEHAKRLGKTDKNFRSLGVGVFTVDTESTLIRYEG